MFYSLNRLCELPRGFGSFPALEILDLTYNNLTNSSFSANFSYLGECLRCLYMGDNDLTEFPPQIEKFVHLEIVGLYIIHPAVTVGHFTGLFQINYIFLSKRRNYVYLSKFAPYNKPHNIILSISILDIQYIWRLASVVSPFSPFLLYLAGMHCISFTQGFCILDTACCPSYIE